MECKTLEVPRDYTGDGDDTKILGSLARETAAAVYKSKGN